MQNCLLRLYLFALFFSAGAAQGAGSATAYVQQVTALLTTHQSSVSRLTAPANTTGQALAGGASLYIANNSDPAWFHEAQSPAGGLMALQTYNSGGIPAGSVVWLSYNSKSYQSALTLASTLSQMKAIPIAFGPQPPGGTPPFTNWVDSLTPWTADDDLTLMGNVLSLWTLTGEVAATTSRLGKTLVFSESPSLPGSDVRNAHYRGLTFHAGIPQMSSTQPGVISAAYLNYVAAMLSSISTAEMATLLQIGVGVATRFNSGLTTMMTAESRIIPYVPSLGSTPGLQFLSDSTRLTSTLPSGGSLIHIGYDEANLPLWRVVRAVSGAKAAWINVHLPTQADLTYFGDTVSDQHWDFGDCTVQVPNYDVCILPASGVAQLFIYEILTHAN